MIKINENIKIDETELRFSFIKSSGPGGQNVNKVSTGVQVKFDVMNSPSLTENIKVVLLKNAGRRATKDGIIVIEAKRYRTQEKNKIDAVERLINLIKTSSTIKKKRKRTKPTKASMENRILLKKKKSQQKKLRKNISKNFDQ